jgi:hypothetical protein
LALGWLYPQRGPREPFLGSKRVPKWGFKPGQELLLGLKRDPKGLPRSTQEGLWGLLGPLQPLCVDIQLLVQCHRACRSALWKG